MPRAVLDVYDEVTRAWTGGLLDVYQPTMFAEYRELIGRAYGVDEDEIVISHSATEGVARVIHGLDLHAGDEVIATSHECYSVLSNFNLVAQPARPLAQGADAADGLRRVGRGDRGAVRAGDHPAHQGARVLGDHAVDGDD